MDIWLRVSLRVDKAAAFDYPKAKSQCVLVCNSSKIYQKCKRVVGFICTCLLHVGMHL